MPKSLPKLLLLSSCSVFSLTAIAGGPEIIQAGWFPYPAGATATALSGEIATGFADGMIPIYGKPTEFVYFDPQGQINNSHQYAISAGVGGRYLWQDKGIVGAYLFGDYNHSEFNNSFWFISPGLEFLGDSFDVTGNLYIPVGTQKYSTGDAVFGQDIGIFSGVTFAGHTEYDELFEPTESNGFGGDIDVAYRIPLNKYNPKIHLAGYFSNPQDAEDRAGGAVRFEFPFSKHLNILFADSYDNVSHNTVRAGASYSFGGRHTSYKYKHDLASRMVDPIQRNIIANTSDIHNSQPISENMSDTGDSGIYLDNISFFVPDPGLFTLLEAGGSGTYEHPYTGMTQTQIDIANNQGNNNFFVQSGAYGSSNPAAFGMSTLTLTNDNLYGRQSYNGRLFVQQAEENRRPIFNFSDGEGFELMGFSDTMSSIFIVGDGSGAGIEYMDAPGVSAVVNVNNVEIYNYITGDAIHIVDAIGAIDLTVNVNNVFLYNDEVGIDIEYDPAINYHFNTVTVNVDNSTIRTGLGISDVDDSAATANLNLDNDVIIDSFVNGAQVLGVPAVYASVNEGGVEDSGTMSVSVYQTTLSGGSGDGDALTIKNNSINPLTLHITDTASLFQNSGGAGVNLILMNSGDINANIMNSSFLTNGSGMRFSLVGTASGDINAVVTDSQLTVTGAASLTLGATTSGDINLIVNSTETEPTIWMGAVEENVGVGSTGTMTATFNAENGSFSLVNTNTSNYVYCDSTGACVRF